jgi:hypothetical protein
VEGALRAYRVLNPEDGGLEWRHCLVSMDAAHALRTLGERVVRDHPESSLDVARAERKYLLTVSYSSLEVNVVMSSVTPAPRSVTRSMLSNWSTSSGTPTTGTPW